MKVSTSNLTQEYRQTYRRWLTRNGLPSGKTPADIAAYVDDLDLSDEAAVKNLLRRILLELYAHRVMLRPEDR